jgi:hypothetical protein
MDSVKQQVIDLMRTDTGKWWTAMDLENAVRASSAARRLRELVEEDQDRVKQYPPAMRFKMSDFAERDVPNRLRPGKHKEFRFKGRQPDLQFEMMFATREEQ